MSPPQDAGPPTTAVLQPLVDVAMKYAIGFVLGVAFVVIVMWKR